MKSFKQWLEENYGERPVVKHVSSETIDNPRGKFSLHHFKVDHSSMRYHMNVHVLHNHKNNASHVSVTNDTEDEDHLYSKAGSIGPAHNRYVIGRIRHHAPEVTHIHGSRVTGARGKLGQFDPHKQASIPVGHIKPIGPDE